MVYMNEPKTTPRNAWQKTAITVAGFAVVLAGVVMLVIPGPGLLTIAAGLAILATEYVWAKRLLHQVRERLQKVAAKARKKDQG
jgi:uncharacterized protein (TIGR02611 family)